MLAVDAPVLATTAVDIVGGRWGSASVFGSGDAVHSLRTEGTVGLAVLLLRVAYGWQMVPTISQLCLSK
jgi:hypothetical protein